MEEIEMILKEYDDGKKHIHVLSYGAGTQSTALLLMALEGKINGVIPDYIIFSDTGWEPQKIYDWLNKVNDYIKGKYDREIIIAEGKNIRQDLIEGNGRKSGFVVIPTFVKHEDGSIGMGRRQCTNDYKIIPVNKKIRQLLGYAPRKRVKEVVHIWKGISTDEIQRVKPSREKWQVAEHPLVDIMEVDRQSCILYVEQTGLGTPPKSSCIGCPFRDNNAWREMKLRDPASWKDAVAVDNYLRTATQYQNDKAQNYIHRSGIPLEEVDFQTNQLEFDDMFTNECEGMCGV
jgi:hypothetical protein